jgi:Spy/CpxP family protein refolding chaperone
MKEKTPMKTFTKIFVIGALALGIPALTILPISAQPPQAPPMPQGEPPQGAQMMAPHSVPPQFAPFVGIERLKQALNLTEDQAAKARKIVRDYAARMVKAPENDPQARQQLLTERDQAILGILTPEQKEKSANALLDFIFNSPRFGTGGPGEGMRPNRPMPPMGMPPMMPPEQMMGPQGGPMGPPEDQMVPGEPPMRPMPPIMRARQAEDILQRMDLTDEQRMKIAKISEQKVKAIQNAENDYRQVLTDTQRQAFDEQLQTMRRFRPMDARMRPPRPGGEMPQPSMAPKPAAPAKPEAAPAKPAAPGVVKASPTAATTPKPEAPPAIEDEGQS